MRHFTPSAELSEALQPPRDAEALGIGVNMVNDMIVRRMLAEGRTSLSRLVDTLTLSPTILQPMVSKLRDLALIELDGMDGRNWVMSLTNAGRELAVERARQCSYMSTAPVPLDLYTRVIWLQSAKLTLDRELLTRAMSDLVIAPDLIDMLGPAVQDKGAMFLYGPPGTGKSSLAERLSRAYGDLVAIPRAVTVDGQIITVYDPTVHHAAEEQPPQLDGRWVLCERPCVVAGGELVMSMLDLAHDVSSGTYLSPLQMRANNGVFVIDDFGRQTMTPEQLLNRWIVPLDRGHDYLSLNYGLKFQVPFDVKVAFSTNLPPDRLGDEAFFRRIHHKIYIGCIDDDQFDWILVRVAKKYAVECTQEGAAYLRQVTRSRGDGELRPYLPGVVCSIISSVARYESKPPTLDRESIDRFAITYFTRSLTPSSHQTSPVVAPTPAAQPVPPSPGFIGATSPGGPVRPIGSTHGRPMGMPPAPVHAAR